MKPLLLYLTLLLSTPAFALRSPLPPPPPTQKQTYYSQDLYTAPSGFYVKAFELSDPPSVKLWHPAGGQVYVVGTNGSLPLFNPDDWGNTLWVKVEDVSL